MYYILYNALYTVCMIHIICLLCILLDPNNVCCPLLYHNMPYTYINIYIYKHINCIILIYNIV